MRYRDKDMGPQIWCAIGKHDLTPITPRMGMVKRLKKVIYKVLNHNPVAGSENHDRKHLSKITKNITQRRYNNGVGGKIGILIKGTQQMK